MSMSGDDAYVLAMDYVDETLKGGGALKGDDGKSAYQSWLDLGNTGTEEDFIDSLKGEKGQVGEKGETGNNGKSAYDLWLEAGNVGSEQDFLDSLKGADGTMSFEDLTEEQKESLKGETGADGKSAYQYAKDGGYTGTETEFTTNIARSGVISKELEVERVRIDNLTTLQDGSTTGDAELIDARIDKNGNTHVNVGEHIRTVSSQLSSEIEDTKSDLNSLFDECVNLYDKNSSLNQDNSFYSGEIYEADGYSLSHPIKVSSGLTYKFPFDSNYYSTNYDILGCTENGEKIATLVGIKDGDFLTITMEEIGFGYNCDYVIVNIPTEQKDTFMFCEVDKYPPIYTPFTEKLTTSEKLNIASSLKGKKIAYNGDSICESRLFGFAKNGGAYPKLISDKTGCFYSNRAVSGGTLAVSSAPHNICNDIVNMPNDVDLVCIEGGINDYWMNVQLGTYSESDFTGELDVTTVCGALESIIRQALTKWVGIPICFVITHKIKDTVFVKNYDNGYTFKEQHDVMVKILNKYSIPYYDCFEHGGLNAYIDTLNNAYLNGGSNAHPDGCHPDEGGYIRYYVPQLVKLFESLII